MSLVIRVFRQTFLKQPFSYSATGLRHVSLEDKRLQISFIYLHVFQCPVAFREESLLDGSVSLT